MFHYFSNQEKVLFDEVLMYGKLIQSHGKITDTSRQEPDITMDWQEQSL